MTGQSEHELQLKLQGIRAVREIRSRKRETGRRRRGACVVKVKLKNKRNKRDASHAGSTGWHWHLILLSVNTVGQRECHSFTFLYSSPHNFIHKGWLSPYGRKTGRRKKKRSIIRSLNFHRLGFPCHFLCARSFLSDGRKKWIGKDSWWKMAPLLKKYELRGAGCNKRRLHRPACHEMRHQLIENRNMNDSSHSVYHCSFFFVPLAIQLFTLSAQQPSFIPRQHTSL